MVSLTTYQHSASDSSGESCESEASGLFLSAIQTIRSCLREMGNCSLKVCSALGTELKQSLGELEEGLSTETSRVAMTNTETSIQTRLQEWSSRVSEYYRQKTDEVRGLLLVMANTAESFAARDQRCAGQLSEIADRLERISTLEDLTEARASIQNSAAELQSSVERLTAEGRHSITQLRAEVSAYQAKLEDAEEVASRDSLTGLRNRHWVEKQIESRIGSDASFSVAIMDINRFKHVNDEHGHIVGDELLQQFSSELQSASRSTDVIGRWGGDEFIFVLDGHMPEVKAQIDRLASAACRSYSVESMAGPLNLPVDASVGLAEHISGETLRELLSRADSMMYTVKETNQAGGRSEQKSAIFERRSQPPRLDVAQGTNKIISLVVEDDPSSRELLQSFLSTFGQCDIALNGKEAVDAVLRARENHHGYDLICMDLRMPQMDGQEAIREIRKQEALMKVAKAVKIIVTTSQRDSENIVGALLGRCSAYLSKPIDLSRLRKELKDIGLIL